MTLEQNKIILSQKQPKLAYLVIHSYHIITLQIKNSLEFPGQKTKKRETSVNLCLAVGSTPGF